MLKENIKIDYIKFLLRKAQIDLSHYNFTNDDINQINSIFERLFISENPLKDFYILSNVKEFKNVGKYLIYVLKKMEDNVISFDNLSQNIQTDSEYLLNEILNYFSNPSLNQSFKTVHYENEEEEKSFEDFLRQELNQGSDSIIDDTTDKAEEEPEISEFKKNYLELIQTEGKDSEDVYELPKESINEPVETEQEQTAAFELPTDENNTGDVIEESVLITPKEESELIEEDYTVTEGNINAETEDESVKKNIPEAINENDVSEKIINNENREENTPEKEEQLAPDDRIKLSDEIQEELNSHEEETEEEEEIESVPEIQPANALFLEYENEINEKNGILYTDFEKMIFLLTQKADEDERNEIIGKIIQTSSHLEDVSRKMSLEIISNIYQTITLSFEKISEGKYDLSEGTLNLFKNGLGLIASLIKGDDYFGYKDILKSIENIRNALLEEKVKREEYIKRMKQKREIERNLLEKYPEESQLEKLEQLKKLIKDTENKFKQISEIEGEYKIYEALRSLSGNLINFKEIVKSARELNMQKLVQLSEGAYIFLKFLQNYRINPVTIETREIFGYIIYNLKSLVMDNEAEDIDLFISYLNDPVKIFSKSGKKKI